MSEQPTTLATCTLDQKSDGWHMSLKGQDDEAVESLGPFESREQAEVAFFEMMKDAAVQEIKDNLGIK